jgi:hypothetical protein
MNALALDQAGLRMRLLSVAVSASPVAVFVVDAAGSIVFAEGGAVGALFGGKASLAGDRALEAAADTPALVSAMAQGLEGHRFGGDLTIGERHFSVRLIPLQAGDGLVAGVAGMALEAPTATLEQGSSGLAEILGALLETLPLSAWVLDHRGDVVRDNGHAREHGLEAVRTSREDGPSGRSLVGRVLLEGRETAGVARVRDGNGAVVRLRVQGVPLRNSKGMTVGAVLTAEPPRLPPAPPSIPDLLPQVPTVLSPAWDAFAVGGGPELAWA